MAEAKDMKTFLAGTSAGEAEEWDEAWGTDSFADLELKGVWERTGKGKKRWAPGDTTGDATVDASLLYSTRVGGLKAPVLVPPQLAALAS
tara:strand:+ start:189 stop:458 length:270 start_codon:yes stop_codon:yes gene_type:complete